MSDRIIEVSVSSCTFCDWKSTMESKPRFINDTVFCPECGYELIESKYSEPKEYTDEELEEYIRKLKKKGV